MHCQRVWRLRLVKQEISSLPGLFHWSVDRLPELVEPALEAGVRSFLLFGLPSTTAEDLRSVAKLA